MSAYQDLLIEFGHLTDWVNATDLTDKKFNERANRLIEVRNLLENLNPVIWILDVPKREVTCP